MPTIICDIKEKKIIRELIKKDIEVKENSLISADFIILIKNQDNKTIKVGIERKTSNDFLNSIIDKRIFKQLIALKENFDIPLFIIEGTENIYSIHNFHPNSIRGIMASIAIDFQIPILQTRNLKDTACLLTIIAKRLEKPVKNISLLRKRKPLTTKEQQEFIIESLPGIGPSLAKSLLKNFKTVQRIINASPEELQKIEKIGNKKSKEITRITKETYKD